MNTEAVTTAAAATHTLQFTHAIQRQPSRNSSILTHTVTHAAPIDRTQQTQNAAFANRFAFD